MDFEKDLKEKQMEIENIEKQISDHNSNMLKLTQQKNILDHEIFQIKTALEYIRSKCV